MHCGACTIACAKPGTDCIMLMLFVTDQPPAYPDADQPPAYPVENPPSYCDVQLPSIVTTASPPLSPSDTTTPQNSFIVILEPSTVESSDNVPQSEVNSPPLNTVPLDKVICSC